MTKTYIEQTDEFKSAIHAARHIAMKHPEDGGIKFEKFNDVIRAALGNTITDNIIVAQYNESSNKD